MATPPDPIAAAPALPSSSDPEATFDAAFEAFFNWEKNTLRPGVNAAAQVTFENAQEAATSRDTAVSAAVAASTAASTATGAANFKGEWSSLTGPLARPACVKHAGRFWLLLADVADVTAHTPGAAAAWTALDAGIRPTAVITTNTAGIVGVCYLLAASGITLTAPTAWLQGDYFGFREVAGLSGAVVDFGATKVRGVPVSTDGLLVLEPSCGIDLGFEDATRGLV